MKLLKKNEYLKQQKILRLLDDCYNKDINKIKISKANTYAHEKKKFDVCWELLQQGFSFVTEARFKQNKGRCDVLDITNGYGIEIVCSEKEESIVKKKQKYPVPFIIVKVEA